MHGKIKAAVQEVDKYNRGTQVVCDSSTRAVPTVCAQQPSHVRAGILGAAREWLCKSDNLYSGRKSTLVSSLYRRVVTLLRRFCSWKKSRRHQTC